MSNYNFFVKNLDRKFSPNTIRVAEFMARLSDKSSSEFALDKNYVCNILMISRSTLNKAIKILLDSGIIRETLTSSVRDRKYEWIFTNTKSGEANTKKQGHSNHSTLTRHQHTLQKNSLIRNKSFSLKDESAQNQPNLTQLDLDTHNDRVVGVGPWPGGKENWPTEDHYDLELLENGDRRNVLDHYRYWKMSAIIVDLDKNYRTSLHIAIENLEHDYNIGSIVRSANAFGVNTVHIVGKKRWNRRGAMVTDRYQHIVHHSTFDEFTAWCKEHEMPIIGIDILETSKPIEKATLPENCMMLFGQEGAGISKELLDRCEQVLHITQRGSTRSINVGAAAAVAMYTWGLQHANDF